MAFKFSKRSEERLVGVHPNLLKVVRRALEITKTDFTVIEGVRSLETQRKYVASGASRAMSSKHLKQADGYGHAVDLYPWVNGRLVNDWTVEWLTPAESKAAWANVAEAMKRAAAELGVKIKWGGDWLKFKDGPHYELAD